MASILTIIAIFSQPILTNQVSAVPVVGFNASNIIDDFVFTNNNTMSANDIQAFLNSKVSSCDTNGTWPATDFGRPDLTHAQYAATPIAGVKGVWSTPPYTCLKDYSENGISSAQIIYNIAQQYKINPQVLIVLLQKEQALVTDIWPLATQYRTATGYGCPDTTSCDSQYYGLTNQLQWSGKMFRAILNNSPTWYTPYVLGNNYVKWHPDFDSGRRDAQGNIIWEDRCGGTTVNIENRSTQALYNYTPYQPNQAALNSGYGTGDGCSAYGNRNFYLYFTDWFGSVRTNDTFNPHPNGTLVNVNNAIYIIWSGTLHHITTGTVFESNSFRWEDVKPSTSGDRLLSISWPLDFVQPGMLYVGNGDGVYTSVYENGEWVKQLVSYSSFVSLGYNWGQIRYINSDDFPAKTSQSILTSSLHPQGTLIKNSQGVFLIDHGTRRYVSLPVFYSHRWKWGDIVEETAADRQLPIGADMLLREGTIINDGTGLYVIEIQSSGPEIKSPIGPWECYSNIYRYNLQEIIQMSQQAAPTRVGSRITC